MTSNNNKIKTGFLFYIGRFVCYLVCKIMWRYKVRGHENIPAGGGFLVASNHVSYIDPPLVGSAVKRPLFFMAKQELFDVPVLGFILRNANVFPVRRGSQDMSAIRYTLNVLKSGKGVLVFPEGTRSKDGNFGEARAGSGMIACYAQVPVVPVRVFNSYNASVFTRIEVVFGKPIYPPKEYNREIYQQFSEQILEEIKKLQ